MIALTAEMSDIKISVVELEKERDFYFNKVSPIALLLLPCDMWYDVWGLMYCGC